jgi:hypothetical protein
VGRAVTPRVVSDFLGMLDDAVQGGTGRMQGGSSKPETRRAGKGIGTDDILFFVFLVFSCASHATQ